MALELYEPISRSERVRTLADVLERTHELPAHGDYLDQMRFLCDARAILHETTRAHIASAATLPPEAARLRSFRGALTLWIDDAAEQLGAKEAPDVAWIVGWSRLALAWGLVCFVNVLLDPRTDTFSPVSSEWLRAQELVVGAGMVVEDYSATELIDAMYQLRRRLERLESLDVSLLRYLAALERRCSVLVVGAFARADAVHDDVRWRSDTRDAGTKASRSFVTASAWWFLVCRRYFRDYRETMLPSFYSGPGALGAAPTCPVDALRIGDRRLFARVYQFVIERAAIYKTEHHTKAFRATASAYATAPGDIEACERVRTDGERVGWREAMTTMASGPAADFVARSKFSRKLLPWIKQGAYRREHNDGRPALGGDGLFEELAVLHVVRVFFRNQYQISFGEWFVVMHRNSAKRARDYQLRIRQKLAVPCPRPFIVQRLGRWGVVVPRVEEDDADGAVPLSPVSLERRAFITMGIELSRRHGNDEQHAQLYEFTSILDAFTAWCVFMHYGWGGRMHAHSTCARLLHELLALRDGDDVTSSASRATGALAPIGRPRAAPEGTILADL